jgi:type I restriction enzyme S subunit
MTRKMKDSGIERIGEIPEELEIKRLQLGLTEITNKNEPVQTENILSLTKDRGVIPYEEKGNQGNKSKADYKDYKLAYPNSIVMNSMNVIIGSVGISEYFGCVSPVYYVFKAKEGNDIRYFNYIFQLSVFQQELKKYANGILEIRLRVSSDSVLKRKVPFPSYDRQCLISNFLDKKCNSIDKIKKIIEQEIQILEEYKKSLITEAVTKGLDPDVEMKDSGIEWIGEIPKHWSMGRLKHFLSENLKYGASEAGVEYDENLPRYIRITDIDENNQLKENNKLSLTENQAKGYILKNDAILFARSGATVGKTFYYTKDYGYAAFAGYLIAAYCDENKLLTKWLYYYTLSNTYKEWTNHIFTQSTIQNIGADKYSNLPIVVADKQTQQEIVSYLDEKCKIIDDAIKKKNQQVEILEDYKKSLIYEYVTGKKEVPHA